jgi:hypothetical protein
MMFIVPPCGYVHEMLCILSYNDRVFFALSVDPRAIENPDRLCELFNVELREMANQLT